ncbi:MAG: nickel-dependent lactate racemase [Deltaproteobacteria bacterium]|jgi:nickel-dependent lactate racemase|nr:nickel-dependent lactate racemase [Deltaproteobacteria bacterium]
MTPKRTVIRIPYGTGFESVSVDPERDVRILSPREEAGAENPPPEETIIARALENPINSPPLKVLARGKKKVAILTSDHTRPVPSRLTVPPMLAEIREGSPGADITILIGVGCHRATTREEMRAKFGDEVASGERILCHDPGDESNLADLGRLPSGGLLRLNKLAVEADLLVADGFIEPHQFAGFSGGRKSVLPGVAAFKTVLASHNAVFTVHPKARPGSLDGNPFQEDMIHAARKARLAFILNVTLTPGKRVSRAFAGDFEAAHLKGCESVLAECEVKAAPAPVVITSNGGYPLDQNIYQSTKSVMAADLTCADGGVIVAVNECRDGHGSEQFLESFKTASSLPALIKEIESRSWEETIPDQWVIQLTASILARRRVVMVTKADAGEVEALGMTKRESLAEGLELADRMVGSPGSPITVLPNAVAVVISP